MKKTNTVMEVISEDNWTYAPLLSSSGKIRTKPEIKTVLEIKTNLVRELVLITSDLHEYTLQVFKDFHSNYTLDNYHVICAGDMSGKGKRGSDDNPITAYEFISENAKSFYFVQGNHDLPDPDGKELKLKNKDDTYCMLRDATKVKTTIGSMIGVNGTVSTKEHPYKKTPEQFFSLIKKSLQVPTGFFITHESPAIPKPDGKSFHNGKQELYKLVDQYKPKIHIYGHCYHTEPYRIINGVTYINCDSRLIILTPL
jgi:Icc-related predicted phosphoesterase